MPCTDPPAVVLRDPLARLSTYWHGPHRPLRTLVAHERRAVAFWLQAMDEWHASPSGVPPAPPRCVAVPRRPVPSLGKLATVCAALVMLACGDGIQGEALVKPLPAGPRCDYETVVVTSPDTGVPFVAAPGWCAAIAADQCAECPADMAGDCPASFSSKVRCRRADGS